MKDRSKLVILIGGGSFVGKSSVSMRLAQILSIPCVLTTDYIREAIKPYVSGNDREILSAATYKVCELYNDCSKEGVIQGFRKQFELAFRSVLPIVDRCLSHGEMAIIEGIHLVPALLTQYFGKSGEIISFMISTNQEQHLRNIEIAINTTRFRRPLSNYVANFDRIRLIHDYLHDEAQRNALTEIVNTDLNLTTSQICGLLS